VRFSAAEVPDTAGICHCEMCRRWTGSALIGVSVPTGSVTWTGAGKIRQRQTSHWARRAWCDDCGTALYFEVTMDSPYKGNIELPVGIFDDPNGFEVKSEIYIDHKPDTYAFAGTGRKTLTRAECVAEFGVLDDD